MQIITSGVQRLLVRLPATSGRADLFKTGSTTGVGFQVVDVPGLHSATGAALGHTDTSGNQWQLALPLTATAALQPWDAAHDLSRRVKSDTGVDTYVEPDFLQQPPLRNRPATLAALDGPICQPSPYSDDWGPTAGLPFGWHLGTAFSGLKDARDAVGDTLSSAGRRVRIAHLDTGYDPNHISLPMRLRTDMAWNFVDNNNSAVAPISAGGLFADPSHGTATLALLAGKQVPQFGGDFLGGAPYADIVPVRIGNTWLHLGTSALANGINHAVGWGCDVISMSAGGIPAQSWVDAVNRAYDAGCCIFAASGDSKGGLPTHLTIYPARFKRVVSVCGVTHENKPYFDDKFFLSDRVEGSWGPMSAMDTAISAYAPNVPWAKQGCPTVFDNDGSGTSSATPQAAAAGALWLQMNFDALASAEPWQRVEAVRYALFASAGSSGVDREHFGNGTLRATEALKIPFDPSKLTKRPADNIDFALFKELFGVPSLVAAADLTGGGGITNSQQQMLKVEALQLVMLSPRLSRLVGDADLESDTLKGPTRIALIDGLIAEPATSQTLRTFLISAATKLKSSAP